jgi:hypothetical protein
LTRSPFDSIGQLADGYCSLRGGCRRDTRGPLFALHSLPDGTFTFDDAVARNAARQVCPSSPTFAFGETPGAKAFAQGVERFVCMLVWQAPRATIKDELDHVKRVFCRDAECDELDSLRQKSQSPELWLPRLP